MANFGELIYNIDDPPASGKNKKIARPSFPEKFGRMFLFLESYIYTPAQKASQKIIDRSFLK